MLRHRAGELRRFAQAIEHATVFALDEAFDEPAATSRLALCRRILGTNLQQLLGAADDLRDIAWQLDVRAAHLDAGPQVA